MAMDSGSTVLGLSDAHPLAEEISSLRALVARFQNESHTASIKLQRHALDTSASTARIAALESENALLASELTVLRANPAPTSTDASSPPETIAELTLSLRRLSAKLSLTEDALRDTTLALTQAEAQARQRALEAEQAYALAARARAREEEGKGRERALEDSLRGAQEEARRSDAVVREYAALVRKLEGRTSASLGRGEVEGMGMGMGTGSSTTLVEPTVPPTPGPVPPPKSPGYEAFFTNSNPGTPTPPQHDNEKESMHNAAEVEAVTAQLQAAHLLAQELGAELARARFEREVMRVEDGGARAVVERYMKFTQQTTLTLHAALDALRARHAATLATLEGTVGRLEGEVRAERGDVTRLRTALDETSRTLFREQVARRREVALRVRMVGREEGVVRGLRDALSSLSSLSLSSPSLSSSTLELDADAAEHGDRNTDGREGKALRRLVRDVRAVLAALDSAEGTGAGTEGRMRLLESAVEMLVGELEEVGREAQARGEEPDVVPEKTEVVVDVVQEKAEPEVEDGVATVEVEVKAEVVAEDNGDVDASTATPVDAVQANASADVVETPPVEDQTTTPAESELDVPAPTPTTPPDVAPPVIAFPSSDDVPPVVDDEDDTDTKAADTDETETPGPAGLVVEDADEASAPTPMAFPSSDDAEDTKATEIEQPATPAPPPIAVEDADASVAFPSSDNSQDSKAADIEEPATTIVVEDADVVPTPTPVALPSSSDSTEPRTKPAARAVTPPAPPAASTTTPTHPLLADLAAASKRYDALQRAFRDCHVALQALRAHPHPPPVLQSAAERLHDYTEDARVELEIRVADGRVLARGWEAIVAARPSAGAGDDGDARGEGDAAGGEEEEGVREQIAACVERDRVAQEGFQRKLDDVEHDIAVVKAVLYAPPSVDEASSSSPPLLGGEPVAPSPAPGWAAWLGGAGTGTRSRTPPLPSPTGYADADPAQQLTFGGVMTSPRLRHSASAARLAQHHKKRASDENPFEGLGLRVPMPAYVAPQAPTKQEGQGRQRTISGVYMLGLGVGAGAGGAQGKGRGRVPSTLGGAGRAVAAAADAGEDVE
ncbi:hypothetical protein C8R46DRAFT_1305621 [Mycena filopes]|nr:hypothetical protein C8R46DRAFT_1305621 [Mycena filopes]